MQELLFPGSIPALVLAFFLRKRVEIFLDLEGTGEQVQDEELVAIDYLIGLLVRSDGQEEYIPFVAHNLKDEKMMFYESCAGF